MEVATCERAVAAALAEPDGVDSQVGELAVLDRDVPCAVGHDDGLDGRGGLRRFESARRRNPLTVLERKALEGDMFHELLRGRIALDEQEPLDDRGDDLDLGHVLAGKRQVGELAVASEEPFSGMSRAERKFSR